MAITSDQKNEIDLFHKQVEIENPSDIIQFGANYFNRRLELQRGFIKKQENFALSKGISLFPNDMAQDPMSTTHRSSSAVNFKSPFVDQDPHSIHSGPHSNNSSSEPFKSNFNVTTESKKRINSPMDPSQSNDDPSAGSNFKRSSPHPSNLSPIPVHFNAERRTSVSGETLQPGNFDDWTPEHYKEKSEEQLKRLEKSIGKNFLFNKLDHDNKRLVINCLEEKHVPKETVIIKQGDQGDYFYIVEDGNVEFIVNDAKVSSSGSGSSFGELALMYNSPRAATVIATSDCILWALDRLTFRKILLGSSFKKRVLYDDLLKSIPVLKSLTTYERAKLADALDTKYYEPDQVIIKEGDVGENFYLIEYGECQVTREDKGLLTTLHKGDYFGEVALLNDLPRQATVTASKKTKVATLGKSGFQRLLGPAVEVLKLNDPTRSSRE
ncbi:hypothetical protein KAFR_0A02590 [Kazachstania africana CBS 2517]|uniref:cAMP-dependent protein kinase regulatory subunit n=1 Tax=Kazachstania africana (strain ATCC 22294 / BCRC 22015 / CBS 2517 / CECT 1963 / NBRC 1671 / NRRL Y-8276) TaxID=1071382 RepID=H2AMU5_KAZAF|nr:hypothetical protein KAFR_0A02590 [Kazachstania africana CBS 2517]CCF55695.1 hypothetical protein KAFR_0A02590 [Kazachstania africana CBS 2517]